MTLDTTRADHLGSYGYTLARTPKLDALARSGVRVAHATSVAPITAPAHASILTGLLPPTHGVRDNGSFRLPDEVETLPEVLRAQGYATAAFVSAAVLDSRYNMSQGFDRYDDDFWSENAPEMFMIRERAGARTAERAIEWLNAQHKAKPDQPFFLWVHFFDVHEPHKPALIDSVLVPSRYDAEIAGVDRHAGAVIDAVDALWSPHRTLVAVTADHGESLGEHGETTHGVFAYEATLHVPLLFRWPGRLPSGQVYAGEVQQIDLMPTILAAVQSSRAPAMQGVNLLDAIAGKAPAPDRLLYSESKLSELGFGMAPVHALRDEHYTYVRAPRPELYDRRTDPGERTNVFDAQPDVAAELATELDRVMRDAEARAFKAPEAPVDPKNSELLRALGYVGDTATRKEVASMDPKDGIQYYEKLHKARQLVRTARNREAEAPLQELLALTPRNVSALNVLALSKARDGRPELADQRYRESLAIEPNQPRVHLALATLALKRKDLDAAAKQAEEAVKLSPEFIEALVLQGVIALRRGDKPQADRFYTRALAADPKYPRALTAYAELYFEQDDFARALEYYEKALARTPKHFEALIGAGASARRTGDFPDALAYYERAAGLRPDSWIPPYNIACVHAVVGERAAALDALHRAVARGISDPELLERDPDFTSLRADPEFTKLANRAELAKRPQLLGNR